MVAPPKSGCMTRAVNVPILDSPLPHKSDFFVAETRKDLYVGPLTSGAFPDWFVLSNLSWPDFMSPSAGTGRMRWI